MYKIEIFDFDSYLLDSIDIVDYTHFMKVKDFLSDYEVDVITSFEVTYITNNQTLEDVEYWMMMFDTNYHGVAK